MTTAKRSRDMPGALRVCSLNLRAYPSPDAGQTNRLAALLAAQEPDVVLLQECRRSWLPVICHATEMDGVHAHDVAPATPRSAYPPDGTAIAVRDHLDIESAWRVEPDEFMPATVHQHLPEPEPDGFQPMPERLAYRYSSRSLLARVRLGAQRFVVASLHATPGTGMVGGVRVHEWKPFFHGAAAVHLARLDLPFVFAIDANEPLAETIDDIEFHWADGRSGVEKFRALLGLDPIHPARDLFRQWLVEQDLGPHSDGVLLPTYAPNDDFQRRFDSMWATPDFELAKFSTHLDEVVDAGGDHAMLVADLRLATRPGSAS